MAGSAADVEVSLIAKVVNGQRARQGRRRGGQRHGGHAAVRRARALRGARRRVGRVLGGAAGRALQGDDRGAGLPDKEVPLDIVGGPGPRARRHAAAGEPGRHADAARRSCCASRSSSRPGAPKLDATVKAELDGVADILADHPEIQTLRIEAHWNGAAQGKGASKAKKLTDKQAAAIKDYLVARGRRPTGSRRSGWGGESPLVPEPRPRQPGQEPPRRAGRRPVGAAWHRTGGSARAWL